jgi:putative restriction endonuclease
LLIDFGPPRKSFHPEYPFWHLLSDGIWAIPQVDELAADLKNRSRQNNPPKSVLIRVGAEGGFTPELFDYLRSRPELVNRIAQQVLEDQWEPSYFEDILNAVGMPWVTVARQPRRDPAFRDTILRIYEHRCAVCGYDGMLGGTNLAIEAAHLRWRTAGGSDTEENGVALCSFHHKVLDRGAIGLDESHRILISEHLHGSQGIEELLLRHLGSTLRFPQPGRPPPAPENIAWHRREVFRNPPRLATES